MLQIAGADTRIGLARTGGDEALYRRLLKRFLEIEPDFVARFEQAIASADLPRARRAARDLRISAETLGAMALARSVEHLEEAIDRGFDGALLTSFVRTVQDELDPLMTELRRVL